MAGANAGRGNKETAGSGEVKTGSNQLQIHATSVVKDSGEDSFVNILSNF